MTSRELDPGERPVSVRTDRFAKRQTSTNAEPRIEAPAMPDLRRLYAFIVVAEELHFRRAAQRLAMAQSPLSRLIKGLERDVGAVLFKRTRRSVKLTRAGEALLHDARQLLGQTERAVKRARRLEDGGA